MSRHVAIDAAPASHRRWRAPANTTAEEAQLEASMNAFDQREHARHEAAFRARQRALFAVAKDAAKSVEERTEAVIAGLSLRKVLWANATVSGAVVHPTDGKHVRDNRAAVTRLIEVLPKVGLVGAAVGQDVLVTVAAPASTPPSGPRPLLAADREYQRLRRVALDAFGALAGDLGSGVARIGGPIDPEDRRDLAGLAKDLSTAAHFPSGGSLPSVAAACAQRARDVAVKTTDEGHESIAVKAWKAAEACVDLARFVDEWNVRLAGGGA